MRRFLTSLATFSLIETIGRRPALAAGVLTLLGIGGGAGIALLTTPTITPQVSAYFNQNQSIGATNNGLKPNGGGAAGALEQPVGPSGGATGSFGLYFEAMTDPNMQYANGGSETAFAGLVELLNYSPGQPTFRFQRNIANAAGTNWLISTDAVGNSNLSVSGPSNYATGLYPFTATGGGCAREPSGVWEGNAGPVNITDPGFLCETTPTLSVASIPGAGGQQSTNAGGLGTTCSAATGEMVVTAHVAVAHGLTPGQQYTMQDFTPTGYNGTYTALPGTTGTTLVGRPTTTTASCPAAVSVEGTALGGTGGTFNFPAISTSNPFNNGATGITAKNGQHICGFIGEMGDDATSPFPGGQFVHMVDDKGNPLPGAPAVFPWLNQGTANATGYVLANTQSPSSPALTITAVNPYPITGASYNATTGFVTFTLNSTPGAPGFVPGSEFTVTGMSPSGYNGTYVAVNPTSLSTSAYQASTTIYGNPLSGPVGTPQAISNPGSFVSGGSLSSVILPGMSLLGGQQSGGSGFTYILPYGTYGGTGTGGTGTYALSQNQGPGAAFTVSAVNTTTGAITTSALPANYPLVLGSTFTLGGNTFVVTSVNSATTYTVNNAASLVTGTATPQGLINSSASPGNIFTWAAAYYTAAAGVTASVPSGGVVTARTQALFGDFTNAFGAATTAISGSTKTGWGGSLGNMAMLWGVLPNSGGGPTTSALASLCKKQTTIPAFAAANGMTVRSFYPLNDIGIYGDAGVAQVSGYITATSGATTGTLNLNGAPITGSIPTTGTAPTLSGIGVPGCPSACPTLTPGAGPTYTVTWASGIGQNVGSSSAPVAMSLGTYKPALPINAGNFLGGISGTTLTVSSLDNGSQAGLVKFTGTLGSNFTGSVSGNTLTVTAVSGSNPVLGIGTIVSDAVGCASGCMTPATVTAFGTGAGMTGTYTLNGSAQTIASRYLFGSGPLPGAPNNLQTTNATGTFLVGQAVTGATLTGSPLLITAVGANGVTVTPSYYPNINADPTMVASLTTLVPGSYVQAAGTAQATPVKVLSYQGACGQSSAYNGGPGCYTILNPGSVSVSPGTVFTATSIQDGGAIAPGSALTIRDQGPGVIFPVTNYGAGTGSLWLSGTYDTSALGGVPAPAIQAQVSLSANGPPVPGCSACAWTNLSGYSASLSSGTVYNWSGQALNIPANYGPLYVSVRAANGTAYATLPSSVRVGSVFPVWGEGQAGALFGAQSGLNISYYTGLWGLNETRSSYVSNLGYLMGPPIGSTTFVPGQVTATAGDRFGVSGGLTEGIGAFDQTLGNAFGWPAGLANITRDGIGIEPMTLGGATQTQTVGVGNGTLTTWCSASAFCPNTSPSAISVAGPLYFNAATLTGATLAGASISGTTLTVPANSGSPPTAGIVQGLLEPGMVLSDTAGQITPGTTLVNCLTGCAIGNVANGGGFGAQTWTVSASQSVSAEAMRADPAGGVAPWPTFAIQQESGLPITLSGFGAFIIKAGTFKVSVNGTVVCQDSQTFAYNQTGGNCTGAGISSSFVNYQTGDYEVVFSSPPTGPVIASWTSIVTPEPLVNYLNRPQGIDFVGDGTAQGGMISAIANKTPGGVSGFIDAGCSSELSYVEGEIGSSFPGYQFGAPGYTQMASWLNDSRFASLPGFSASTPFLSTGQWRTEGAYSLIAPGDPGQGLCDQWGIDVVTKSTFSGTISGGVLTLGASAAVGPMWEGEVVSCAPFSLTCAIPQGVYITSLHSGAWGAAGSSYNLAGASGLTVSSATAMQNAVYYQGPGPAIYAGPLNDIMVQVFAFAQSTGDSVHMGPGPAGGRRAGSRFAASAWCGLNGSITCGAPTVDRASADAGGCDTSALASPCFDIGNTYAASATATWTGNTVTITGGLAAHARPLVDGQAVTCSGCNANLVIMSLSVPPTQSTAAGAGEVGQTFTFTTNAAIGGSGSGTITAGCSGTAGSGGGSNCMDIAISINNSGSFGTAAAIATCGANNFNGNAPNYNYPNGKCQANGIGEIVRTFRIGTTQAMYGGVTGSVFDDGIDLWGGAFNQSAAFTCNIVASKVVQCVKAPAYTLSPFSIALGKWAAPVSGVPQTFVNYGDLNVVSGRNASLLGYVGGQSFPFTAGSGYTNGTYTIPANTASCGLASGGYVPKVDVTVSGGSIVNVYPSATSSPTSPAMGLGVGAACTFPLTALGSGSGGAIGALTIAPDEGVGGIATINTDSNTMGMFLYDNSGFPGNPLNGFFTNGQGGYWEPGMGVKPFGIFQGVAVSG